MKTINLAAIDAALERHERVALQLSGGRDSLACYHLLKPYMELITVYWLNTGDAFPETIRQIDKLKREIPNFVEIASDAPLCRGTLGNPTDILPRSSTPIGLSNGKSDYAMQDSYSCCARVIIAPLHQKMLDDGITLIIRGQKDSDSHKAPFQSGFTELGIEYLFPIEDWMPDDVMAYLLSVNADIPPFYSVIDSSLDCMGCTGWWSDGRASYIKVAHPELYQSYLEKMAIIRGEIESHIHHFNIEIE